MAEVTRRHVEELRKEGWEVDDVGNAYRRVDPETNNSCFRPALELFPVSEEPLLPRRGQGCLAGSLSREALKRVKNPQRDFGTVRHASALSISERREPTRRLLPESFWWPASASSRGP